MSERKLNHEAWARSMIGFIRERGLESAFQDWCGGWPCRVASPDATPQPTERHEEPRMNDAQIKRMTERFLGWKLPDNFHPDAGIKFDPVVNLGTEHQYCHQPTGTNLFDYTQAEAMVRYLVDGLPSITQPTETQRIVAWLRDLFGNHEKPFGLVEDYGSRWALKHAADAIEAGEHLAGEGE